MLNLMLLQYTYSTTDENIQRRNDYAYATWCEFLRTDPSACMVTAADFPRDSSVVGCKRRVAFVKDLFDYGAAMAKRHDAAVLFVNSDVAVVPTMGRYIRAELSKGLCCYGQRADVARFGNPLSFEALSRAQLQGGTDLFCFTPEWWEHVRDEVPDILLGTEGWDFVMKSLMARAGFSRMPCVIYHENHYSYWKRPENIITDPAQAHNRRLCTEWAQRCRYHHCLGGGPRGFLFQVQRENTTPLVIQLARYGDIISILPAVQWIADQNKTPVDWLVHKAFADVFQDCSYVRPILFDSSDPQDMHGAIAYAKRYYPRRTYLIPQVNANPIRHPRKMLNFIREQWDRAGMLPLFHRAPMIFDLRDAAHDAQVVAQHWPNTDKPVLLMNLSGHSSPYPFHKEMRQWVRSTFAQKYTVMDVSDMRLPRFLDMLPLLERAEVMLTIDSALVHLAQATNTPTAVLSRDTTWYQSEPKRHWVAHVSYSASITPPGRALLRNAVDNPAAFIGKLVRAVT